MIGIFDSGVGGLTVAKEIKKTLPDARIIYFGDTARLPYGSRSQEVIQRYSQEIVNFLKTEGCETIIIACNTASALAADYLRKKNPTVKIFDVVSSGAKAVTEATKKKKVAVIGTKGTISSQVYNKKISEIDPLIEVFTGSCPLFVPLVEENWIRRPETKKIARVYLRPLKLKGVDTLLLGCTHYPLLKKVIAAAMGKRTKVVASGKKLAEELKNSGLNFEKGSDKFYVSDLTAHFEALAEKILGKRVKVQKVDL
jgi:glutamate racemase